MVPQKHDWDMVVCMWQRTLHFSIKLHMYSKTFDIRVKAGCGTHDHELNPLLSFNLKMVSLTQTNPISPAQFYS